MPATTPTISVLMPVYNAQKYLREAMDSILAQTFRDFELIAVDDGSRDRSLAILQNYAQKDPRVKVITRPNTGYSKALNEALHHATGKYLARMDADDISIPRRFELQVEYLRSHPDAVLVGSRILMIDPFGTPQHEPNHKLTHEEIERELLAGAGWSIVHPAAMMVREHVVALNGYRTQFEPSEDLDLFLRLAERGRIANLPEVLLHYRQHAKSVNHTRFEEQNRTKQTIISEAYARRGLSLPADWTPPRRNVIPVEKELNMWGWTALKKAYRSAARRHAFSLLKLAPFSADSWRLMFCAIRGH